MTCSESAKFPITPLLWQRHFNSQIFQILYRPLHDKIYPFMTELENRGKTLYISSQKNITFFCVVLYVPTLRLFLYGSKQ